MSTKQGREISSWVNGQSAQSSFSQSAFWPICETIQKAFSERFTQWFLVKKILIKKCLCRSKKCNLLSLRRFLQLLYFSSAVVVKFDLIFSVKTAIMESLDCTNLMDDDTDQVNVARKLTPPSMLQPLTHPEVISADKMMSLSLRADAENNQVSLFKILLDWC